MGKFIAILFLLGGAAVIRSLMRSDINAAFLATGCVLLSVAMVLFIMQLRKI